MGIGFTAPVTTTSPGYPAPALARLIVQNGNIGHLGSGTYGDFASNTWAGIGFSGGGGSAYGFAASSNSRAAYYNLVGGDVVAGFGGADATNTSAARWRLQAITQPNGPTSAIKDLLIANPLGAISLFRDPAGTPADPNVSLYVDGRQSAATFQDIFIQNRNATAFSPNLQTFSAIGKIGNAMPSHLWRPTVSARKPVMEITRHNSVVLL